MSKPKMDLPLLLKILVVLLLAGFSYFLGWRWFMGFGFVAIIAGSCLVPLVQDWLRRSAEWYGVPINEFKLAAERKRKHSLQPFLVGVIERTFFTILIAFKMQGIPTALMLWVGAKMLSGWNRQPEDTFENRVRSFNALMMNIISLAFAVIGGLIINGEIKLWFLPPD